MIAIRIELVDIQPCRAIQVRAHFLGKDAVTQALCFA
jgi:hypothetical protein